MKKYQNGKIIRFPLSIIIKYKHALKHFLSWEWKKSLRRGVFTSETHIKDISLELVAYRRYYSN